MTNVEILKHHLKNRIDFGYFPFSDWSNMINDAIEAAITALEKPDGQSLLEKVRKYLKETPREQVLADWDATSHIEGGITVDEYLASLQPAPVYHYLPEVPKGKTWVFSFNTQDKDGRESYFVNGQFTDGCGGYLPTPYAWCEIPPKPPVKEGGKP